MTIIFLVGQFIVRTTDKKIIYKRNIIVNILMKQIYTYVLRILVFFTRGSLFNGIKMDKMLIDILYNNYFGYFTEYSYFLYLYWFLFVKYALDYTFLLTTTTIRLWLTHPL